MKLNMKTVLRLAVIFVSFTQMTFAQTFLNLDFEKNKDGKPEGWLFAGEGYKMYSDTTTRLIGKNSLCMERVKEDGKVASAVIIMSAGRVKGKTIKYSGYIKTENVKGGYAYLWLRVVNDDKQLQYNDMDREGVKNSKDWQKLTIELTIDEKATEIALGLRLQGSGKAWFDHLQIEVDGNVYDDIIPGVIK